MPGMQNTSLYARFSLALLLAGVFAAAPAARQLPASTATSSAQAVAQAPAAQRQDAVAGVRNFTRVDATIACGGALSPEAFAAIRQAGFRSIVNLRTATEPGANVEVEARAAGNEGLTYIHLPFSSSSPDPGKVDEFLKAVVRSENQPMLLHCTSGGRASMFWAIKRVMIDGWTVDRAMNELPDLAKNVGEPLRAFTLDYLKNHGKTRP